MNTPLLCTGFHRDETRRPQPEPGLAYCQTCLNRLHHTLTDIAMHRAILPEFTEPGSAPADTEPTGHTKRTPPAAGRLDVIAAMDPRTARPAKDDPDPIWPVDAVILNWHHTWTTRLGHTHTTTNPIEAVYWQTTHLHRIATWTDLTDYDTDMRRTGRALRHLTSDTPPPPIGQCPQTDDEGQPCKGPLTFTGNTNRHVRCSRCHTTWHTSELTHLIALIQPGRPVSIPVSAVLQRHPHLPARTLRHWANTGKVRRYTHGHVDYTDVLRALNLDTPTITSA